MAAATEKKKPNWTDLKWTFIVTVLLVAGFKDVPYVWELTAYDVVKYLGVAVVLLLFWVLEKSGIWVKPEVERTTTPAVKAVFKRYSGRYDNSGNAYQEAFSVLASSPDKSKAPKLFAAYFDDPIAVEAEKLQYIVGVVGNDFSPETLSLFEKKGYEATSLPEGVPCVYTKFPMFHPSINPINIIFAVNRVYKVLYKELPDAKLAAFEICDSDYTHYYLPIPSNKEQEKLFALGYKKME